VILPGSKDTRSDLRWLIHSGWAQALTSYKENGGSLLGICGWYQMLGHQINDPDGVEGKAGSSTGLGFLPVKTTLTAPKTTTCTHFSWEGAEGKGYEIHMGKTIRMGGHPLFEIHARNGKECRDSDGCVSSDGHASGTYVHGLFDNPRILQQWFFRIGLKDHDIDERSGLAFRDQQYELLAQHFLRHLELRPVMNALGIES
jgi:adenosylcobyric acid synthase